MPRPLPRLDDDEIKSNGIVFKSGPISNQPRRHLHEPPPLPFGYDAFHIKKLSGFDFHDHQNETASSDNVDLTGWCHKASFEDHVAFEAQ